MVKCPLCGYEFKETSTACKGCIFFRRCNLVKCPNCGYEFPLTSSILRKLFRIRKKGGLNA